MTFHPTSLEDLILSVLHLMSFLSAYLADENDWGRSWSPSSELRSFFEPQHDRPLSYPEAESIQDVGRFPHHSTEALQESCYACSWDI